MSELLLVDNFEEDGHLKKTGIEEGGHLKKTGIWKRQAFESDLPLTCVCTGDYDLRLSLFCQHHTLLLQVIIGQQSKFLY